MSSKLPNIIIKRIREEVKKGKSKFQIALELNIAPSTVCNYSKDIPYKRRYNSSIRGATLDLLKQLHNEGYIISKGMSNNIFTLKKHFPSLNLVRVKSQYICFLNGREKDAVKAFLEKNSSKVISFHKLAPICKVFGIALSTEDKAKLLGKEHKSKCRKGIKKRQCSDRISQKNQSKIDDFIHETTFIGNSIHEKTFKIQCSKNNSLLENDDSLAFFCIRNYLKSLKVH